MRKIGILGGTFDPIHIGHIHLAEECMCQLALDRVIFVPAAVSPFKEGQTTAFAERFMMTAIAVARCPQFEISAIEALREGKSYTYDTIIELKALYPEDELYFLTGADSLESLDRWYRWQDILANCCFVAVNRPGYRLQIPEQLTAESELSRKIMLIEAQTEIDISSTELRAHYGEERYWQYLPEGVQSYLVAHKLYRR